MPQLLINIFLSNSEFKNEVKHALFLLKHNDDSDCSKAADLLWLELRFETSADVILLII